MRGGPRACQRDEHHRRGHPVVEPALYVDQPADPGRDDRIEHHVGAEGSVRRCQGRADQQGKPDVHAAEQGQRQQCPQADRERQPRPDQPKAHAKAVSQAPQPDPGRIREQHQDERDLSQGLDCLVSRRDSQHRQRPVRQHQPGDNERDRRRHVRSLQPARQRTPREHQRGHDRQIRSAHRHPGACECVDAAPATAGPSRRNQ
jgi:hypothetical protein